VREQITYKRRTRLWRRFGFPIRLFGCFFSITLSVLLVGFFGSNGSSGNLIWVANGMLLAYLLLAPRWRWPAYLGAGLAGLLLGSVLVHEPWRINLFFNFLNLVEVIIGAVLLRRKSTQLPRFTNGAYLLRFIAFAVVAAPLVASIINTVVQSVWWHQPPLQLFLNWVTADAVGIAVATPIFTAIFQAKSDSRPNWRRNGIYLVLLAAVTVAIFAQSKVPVMFLIYPALILVLLRLGLAWAATSSLFVAFVGGWFTLRGTGPLAASGSLTPSAQCLLLQIFVATGVFMIYSVSVVLESRRSIEHRLERIASLHALVSENSRDAIILADLSGHRTYVSDALERLTGWSPEEFAQHESLSLLHRDDLPQAKSVIRKLRGGAEGATFECRVRRQNGIYIWVEASLRLVRDAKTGKPTGVLHIVRDATERKEAQERLQQAYRTVQALAATDPLTGLANRRRFDQWLNSEWRRASRDRKPLSLLMIDADHFKPYNDAYGHPRGDSCLKQIAEVAQDVASRPGDLVSRFGGEEFGVILPNTDREGAMRLGLEICEVMRQRNLPHSGNPGGIETVSVGCATMVPVVGRRPVNLVELADEALYKAKRGGRDQVCDVDLPELADEASEASAD
jgi:diguanylate cyclase (GGDEF)-like protein/PAS domain S-box-containing protein